MRHNNSNTSGSGVKKNLSKNVIALVVGLMLFVSVATLAACTSSSPEPPPAVNDYTNGYNYSPQQSIDPQPPENDSGRLEEPIDLDSNGGDQGSVQTGPIDLWEGIEPTWYTWRLEDAQGNQTVRMGITTYPGLAGHDTPIYHPGVTLESRESLGVIIPAYDSNTLVIPFTIMATNIRESDTAPIDMFIHLNQIGIGRNSPAQVTSAGAGGNWDWLNVATTAAEGLTSMLIEDAVRLNSIRFLGYLTLDLREGTAAADFGNYTIVFTAGSAGRGITRTVSFQLRDYEDTIILTVALAADLP